MKSQAFGSLLRDFADVLEAAGARPASDQIRDVSTVFLDSSNVNMSDLVRRLNSLPRQGHGSPTLGEVARLVGLLKKLSATTAKAGVVSDMEALEQLLLDRQSMGLPTFLTLAQEASSATPRSKTTSVREDLVTEYLRRLEDQLRNHDQFVALYDDLSANKEIGKAEAVALAKGFARASPKSRSEALKKIWHRHQNLMESIAKNKATGGRSAA